MSVASVASASTWDQRWSWDAGVTNFIVELIRRGTTCLVSSDINEILLVHDTLDVSHVYI